jgi:hypothetical protein
VGCPLSRRSLPHTVRYLVNLKNFYNRQCLNVLIVVGEVNFTALIAGKINLLVQT